MFDFFKGNIWVSLKTTNAKGWLKQAKKWVRDIDKRRASVPGYNGSHSSVLDLRVPKGHATSAEISKLKKYGTKRHVEVSVTEF